ncbi:MAG: TrkA C-terminal domain-containing protein, partial [Victivallaceae bacterium]
LAVTISTLKNEDSAVTILAIHQNDGKFTSRPKLETEIQANDILYLYGTEKEIARFINQNF